MRRPCVLALAAIALLPLHAWAQAAPRLGTVTRLTGRAMVSRAAQGETIPLKFKDAIFDRDRVTTAEKSTARVLLEGKALLTVRELSSLTITDRTGHARVTLVSGKAALSVMRQRMRADETVDIRSTNARVSVGGSIGIEMLKAANPVISAVHVLRGPVEITTGGSVLVLGSRQSVRITDSVIGPLVALGDGDVERLVADLRDEQHQHTDPSSDFTDGMAERHQADLAAPHRGR